MQYDTNKIPLDKYYTPPEIAEYMVRRAREIIGDENISEYIEPSAGAGVFLDYLNKLYLAYDIEPEDSRVVKQDYLTLDIEYRKGRLIIGNPPFGSRMNMAQKFFKKSVMIADYIAFILPISQLNNKNSLYEFDLVHSEDLGINTYTDRDLHCCFNIYKRPVCGKLNKRNSNKLKDITIVRQDSKKFQTMDKYDLRMCYWGDGSAGKILKDGESYSAEYKLVINNKDLKDEIINVLSTVNWHRELNCIAMLKIQQFHIYDILRKYIDSIK